MLLHSSSTIPYQVWTLKQQANKKTRKRSSLTTVKVKTTFMNCTFCSLMIAFLSASSALFSTLVDDSAKKTANKKDLFCRQSIARRFEWRVFWPFNVILCSIGSKDLRDDFKWLINHHVSLTVLSSLSFGGSYLLSCVVFLFCFEVRGYRLSNNKRFLQPITI